MAKSKLTVSGLAKEQAELVGERGQQLARLQELDARLQSGDVPLRELRVAADEMAEVRDFVRVLDRRLVAVGQQLRELEQAEREVRVAELRQVEDSAFLEFCLAVDRLQEGPQQTLLDAQKAVRDVGGFPQYGHVVRTVVRGVNQFQGLQLMRAQHEAHERGRGAL